MGGVDSRFYENQFIVISSDVLCDAFQNRDFLFRFKKRSFRFVLFPSGASGKPTKRAHKGCQLTKFDG